jgi:O-antigen ligase
VHFTTFTPKRLTDFAVVLLFFSVFTSASGIGLATFLLAVFGAVTFWPERAHWRRLPLLWPVLVFCFAVLLSVALAEGTGYSKSLGKLRYFFVYFLLVFYFRGTPQSQEKLAKAAVYFCWLLALITTLQFLGVFCPLFSLGLTPVELAALPGTGGKFFHARGFLYHHNPFAYTTLLLFYLCLGQAVHTTSIRANTFFASGAVAALYSIALSGSRGAWVSLGISLVAIFVLFARKQWKLWLSFLGIALLLAIVFSGPLGRRFSSIRLSENSERLRLWTISWQMFQKSPLVGQGYHRGFENQRYHYMTDSERLNANFPTDPHSLYFDLLATTGLFGLSAFLWWLISAYRNIFRALGKAANDSSQHALLMTGLGSLLCFTIGTAFDSHFFHTQTLVATLFFLALGQAAALRPKIG